MIMWPRAIDTLPEASHSTHCESLLRIRPIRFMNHSDFLLVEFMIFQRLYFDILCSRIQAVSRYREDFFTSIDASTRHVLHFGGQWVGTYAM